MVRRSRIISPPPTDIISGGRGGRGGGGGFSSGFSPGAGPAPQPQPSIQTAGLSRTIPPPQWIRPPNAYDITVSANGTGFNAANTPAVIPGSTRIIPQENVGVLRSLVLVVNNLLTTSQLTWRLRFDGSPVQGWDELGVFPRNAGFVASAYGPDETFIPIPEGITVDAIIDVAAADANTYQAGIEFHGWYYNKGLAAAFDDVYRP